MTGGLEIPSLGESNGLHGNGANGIDLGLRVLNLRQSNPFDFGLPLDEYHQSLLGQLEQSLAVGQQGEISAVEQKSLLFTALLRLGLPLNLPLSVSALGRYTIFDYCNGLLTACLENSIGTDLISAVAAMERHPTRLLLRDSGFDSDAVKINCMELCSMFLPNTLVKVI